MEKISMAIKEVGKMNKVIVRQLFGRFDYEIILDKTGLTILTGPNGYGKSTILKSIDALGNGIKGLLFFFNIDFKEFIFEFENKKLIIKKQASRIIYDNTSIEYEELYSILRRGISRNYSVYRYNEYIYDKNRKGKLSFDDIKKIDDLDDIILDAVNSERIPKSIKNLLPKLDQYKKEIGKIYFIEAQRLYKKHRNTDDEWETAYEVIDDLPYKLKQIIDQVTSNYSIVSSNLDSSYPSRLFNNEIEISPEEYDEKMLLMRNKFEKLSKYNLSTSVDFSNIRFKSEYAKALKIYFDDFDRKFKEYESLIGKLDLYTDIINSRLSFKEAFVSKENGIQVIDRDKPHESLSLNQLSSGEQQEMVLFYELIFESENNSLLLIDEPEISLHISWQKKFMNDLIKVIEAKKLNVIVATHSPQIINNHWDRQIDLGKLYGTRFN